MIVVTELGGLGKLFLHASKPLPSFYFLFFGCTAVCGATRIKHGAFGSEKKNSPND